MSSLTAVSIVGGGIAGLTTALAAAERGLTVIIVDTPRPGAASRAAAGLLAPSLEGLPHGVRAVALEARDAYPGFLERLRARADIEVALDRKGIIELASSHAELALMIAHAPAASQPVKERALAHLEPAFAGHAGAVLHPNDGAVDNVALMQALDLAVSREPRIQRLADNVAALDFNVGKQTIWTAAGLRIESRSVLLASGAWVAGIQGLPHALPVRPVRGQIILLDHSPISHVTYAEGGYLVPRGERLLVGATSEEAGYSSVTTEEGLAALRAIATRAVPSLESATVVDHWAGLRPVTPDALPILGRDPNLPGLVYACGFSRNGILLAPWAAGQLAGVLAGERPADSLDLFSVLRFERGANQ